MNTNSASKVQDVDDAITGNGFVVGTKTVVTSGQRKVQLQSPSGGTSATCGSAVDYTYND
jgi:hypothetical protein